MLAPCPLHEGLEERAARAFARTLTAQQRTPLAETDLAAIVEATDGHPLLIERLTALSRLRDGGALLREVREWSGDAAARLERVYHWHAAQVDAAGERLWATLPLLPAGQAPEAVLQAVAGADGIANLQAAAGVIEFDPERQAWRWHATVAAYAARRWPPDAAARCDRLAGLMDAWRAWLADVDPDDAERRLTAERANLELLTEEARSVPAETARAFLVALYAALPAPGRTLALRTIQAPLSRALFDLARDDGERAGALNDLGVALAALGRYNEALDAARKAADLYRALADERPAAVRPDLAASLHNLGIRLAALGRYDKALAATQESVAIRRALADACPAAFLPDLARSLNVLGDCYAALDQHDAALEAYEAAVRTLLPAFQRLPAAFADQMAYSMRDYATACARLGRAPDAALLAAARQSPESRRQR